MASNRPLAQVNRALAGHVESPPRDGPRCPSPELSLSHHIEGEFRTRDLEGSPRLRLAKYIDRFKTGYKARFGGHGLARRRTRLPSIGNVYGRDVSTCDSA